MLKKCSVNSKHHMEIVIVAICVVASFQLLLMLLLAVCMISVQKTTQNVLFNDANGNYLHLVNRFQRQNVFLKTKNACCLVAAVLVFVKELSCTTTAEDLMPLMRKIVDSRPWM